MRDTVLCLIGDADQDAIRASIDEMAKTVAEYVPGYRLKQQVQFTPIPEGEPVHTLLGEGAAPVTTKVTVFLEVEGAAHYLPAYAGNLDIMTSAALQVGEGLARRLPAQVTA
jgi:acetaldehyde dehydrogenase